MRMPSSAIWEPSERAGLRQSSECEHHLISVPLNPKDEAEGHFDLYFFKPRNPSVHATERNVLFCAGGPGEMVIPGDDELWLSDLTEQGYNVVFFHLRGSGFSQIPASTECDRFIRTKYAVNDIEEIRKQWLNKPKWDAVVGYSYGTVLAQQYAFKCRRALDKLVLIGPLSLHNYVTNPDPLLAYEEHGRKVETVKQEIIRKIYDLRVLDGRVSDKKKELIFNELFGVNREKIENSGSKSKLGIFRTIEEQFAGEWFIVENYDELRRANLLAKCGLDYSRDFFQALRSLRKCGWNPLEQPDYIIRDLESIGLTIAQEIGRSKKSADRERFDASNQKSSIQRSQRDYDVMGIYDGISRRFLKEWLSGGRKDFSYAVRKSAGLAHLNCGVNKHIDKIGVVNSDVEEIEPWNPQKYSHQVPTLVLKGTADPVTAGGQAEYLFDYGLQGPKYLLELPGVGHEYVLPEIKVQSRIFKGAIRDDHFNPVDLMVSCLVEMNRTDFEIALDDISKQLHRVGQILPAVSRNRRQSGKLPNPRYASRDVETSQAGKH